MISWNKINACGSTPFSILVSWCLQYARGVPADDIVLLFDGTVFGSAKDGFIVTPTHVYVHNFLEDNEVFPLSAVLSFNPSSKLQASLRARMRTVIVLAFTVFARLFAVRTHP